MRQNKVKEEVLLSKVPPHSQEVEKSVIGLFLLEPSCITENINHLSEEFFYVRSHQIIFQAIQKMFDNREVIDLITVNNYLSKQNLLDEVGGAYGLIRITSEVVNSIHIKGWIQILQSYYLQRQGIVIGQQLVNDSYSEQEADVSLNKASSSILNVQESVFKNTEKNMLHYLNELEIQRKLSTANGSIGIHTGYNSLNNVISGWVAPDLVILAARPAQGKTAFMLNTILNVLKQKIPVGIFSLEMSGEQLVNRLLSLDSGVAHHKLRHNQMSEQEAANLMASYPRMEKYPLYIDDTPSLNIRDLRSKATIMQRKYGIKFLCIDYLQLMSGIDRKGNRETEISEISRGCKIIAKELNIPVLALSQLSRAVESRADKLPQLSDLRESGSIEQDADSVIFLMRPETYNIPEVEIRGNTINSQGVCVVKIGKNRHGSLRTLPFMFVGESMAFVEYNI